MPVVAENISREPSTNICSKGGVVVVVVELVDVDIDVVVVVVVESNQQHHVIGTVIPLNPWVRVWCCLDMAIPNPYLYPCIPLTRNTRCYPYPCHSLTTMPCHLGSTVFMKHCK